MKYCTNCETEMPDELETCIQCGGVLINKDSVGGKSTSPADVEKKKEWLNEQSKIKDELQDLITRLGGDSSSDDSISTGSTTTERKPTGSLFEEGAKSLLGDRTTSTAPKSEKNPELMKELEDLRAEGYNVTRLEKAINENPESAWKIFSQFLDDVEKIKKLKVRIESLDSTGREIQIANIKSKLNNPDLASELETQVSELEQSPPISSSSEDRAPASPPTKKLETQPVIKRPSESKKHDDDLKKMEEYVESGKDAYRDDDFETALQFFNKALKIEPGNKQIEFFKRKAIAKISEADQGIKSVTAELEAIAGEEAYESWDQELTAKPKKGKKKKKKKDKAKKKVPKIKGKKEVAETRSATELEALGFNAFINKDYQKALEFYEKVLEIDPNFPGVKARIDECKEKM